ncbi:MAG TPA: hypothetical protein IGS37_17905 [Synechococcales cyanobacterium M55_K2018_004]|nr:hypothetical protein [Synechococcales cyanobacterium M55_K2018_004]
MKGLNLERLKRELQILPDTPYFRYLGKDHPEIIAAMEAIASGEVPESGPVTETLFKASLSLETESIWQNMNYGEAASDEEIYNLTLRQFERNHA